MAEDVRDLILNIFEASLDAQVRAVRRLRKDGARAPVERSRKSMSQVNMAYDILKKGRGPLHISEILVRIESTFGMKIDRESLVSSLTKKVARGDRFLRTAKNTFGLKEGIK